jgi:2-keto-4-pentenoate hydratase/2-oxohepta-3-ene-1,7-dioic acid hydratase in catechol pathway
MKLANVRYQDSDLVVLAVADGRLVNVNELEPFRRQPLVKMLDLIRAGAEPIDLLRKALAGDTSKLSEIPPDKVTWYPPVRRPGKVYAVAMNNAASNGHGLDHPAFTLKPASCLIGHREPIRIRRYYGSVHPEPELAAVIWTSMRDVPASKAIDFVFGYTIFNDITGSGMRAEDRVRHAGNGAKSNGAAHPEPPPSYAGRCKGTDSFGVMGPWLVTPDEVPNPDALGVSCEVNGQAVADDSTRFHNYKVAEVLSYISHFHTLDAGDVVSFGRAHDPAKANGLHQTDLQSSGGPVHVAIQGLGRQENTVLIENASLGEWRLR